MNQAELVLKGEHHCAWIEDQWIDHHCACDYKIESYSIVLEFWDSFSNWQTQRDAPAARNSILYHKPSGYVRRVKVMTILRPCHSDIMI